MRGPGVSVIIPAYNAERTLGRCLEALAAQELPPREVIVVDDRSTDATASVALAHGATCLPNSGPKGPGGARNAGAAMATGEILAFLDADCIPPPGWLRAIVEPFADERVGAVGGGYCGGVDETFWQVFCTLELSWRRRGRAGETCSLVSNNLACRRASFEQAGGFPHEYPVCEDMLLTYRISRAHRVLWLADNGVRHHFLTSLPAYLRHQFRFAAESLRFFLDHPGLLAADNHQGKRLHFSILAAGCAAWALAGGLLLLALGLPGWGLALLAAGGLLQAGHWLLYRPFLAWLSRAGFAHVARAYLTSLIRDAACCHAPALGLARWLGSALRKNLRRGASHA